MAEKRVGIRELKTHLSEYIRNVKAGNTVVITDRGVDVGRIIPASGLREERIQNLVRSGFRLTYRSRRQSWPQAICSGVEDLYANTRDGVTGSKS